MTNVLILVHNINKKFGHVVALPISAVLNFFHSQVISISYFTANRKFYTDDILTAPFTAVIMIYSFSSGKELFALNHKMPYIAIEVTTYYKCITFDS